MVSSLCEEYEVNYRNSTPSYSYVFPRIPFVLLAFLYIQIAHYLALHSVQLFCACTFICMDISSTDMLPSSLAQ